MSEKCLYCFRPKDTWKKDPILLLNGSKYKWKSGTTPEETELEEVTDIEKREYTGIYQISYEEVQEIQDTLKELEEENLDEDDRTEFSPMNDGGIFQFTGKHLKEMRDSVEKLLEALGSTKTDYFNYDEKGNHIIHPFGDKVEWTDPITLATDLQKFQIKVIHIEDLRHYITTFALWTTAIAGVGLNHPLRVSDGSSLEYKKLYTNINTTEYDLTICSDISYFYTYGGRFTMYVRKYEKGSGTLLASRYIGGGAESGWQVQSICVDENYVWITYSKYVGSPLFYQVRIMQLQKSDLMILDDEWWLFDDTANSYNNPFMAIDLTYIYVWGENYYIGAELWTKLYRIKKEDKTFIYTSIKGNNGGIGLDENYIYTLQRISAYQIWKLNKSDLSIVTQAEISNFTSMPGTVTVGKTLVYIVGLEYPGDHAAIWIYDKDLNFILKTTTIGGYGVHYSNNIADHLPFGCIFAEEQFKYSLI